MLTVKGKFSQGKIVIDDDQELPENSRVIMHFPNAESNQIVYSHKFDSISALRGNRRHPRFEARNKILLVQNTDERAIHYYSRLLDASAGGISFLSTRLFVEDSTIQVGIADPAQPSEVLMELALEVRGVSCQMGGYKVGCTFMNSLDEGLFFKLSRYIG